ncbi:MAG TPA: Chromate resistance protein ChrB [Dehalococcoidia bacterium]|nr:Chromate resistance protein ChrB [Dehalococcoidia bacterium]
MDRWVLMAYRLPREPSTPRIALWRKLRQLGVAQLLDSLVALPLDSRNREQMGWLADEVVEAGGEASIWVAEPASLAQERELITTLSDAIAAEYKAVLGQAQTAASGDDTTRRRALTRLRRELRRIGERDYYPPPERKQAREAVERLGKTAEVTE